MKAIRSAQSPVPNAIGFAMAIHPHIPPPATWEIAPAAQLAGPIGESLHGPCFVGLQLAMADMPMVLAGLARHVGPQRALYCVDGCNRFDPYRFSDWARRAGMDPSEVLDRVFLSRAFTVHQMAALCREMLPGLVGLEPRPLVVFLGIESLFLDEQIPAFERAHLFDASLREVVSLRQAGLSILATVGMDSGEPGVPSVAPWLAKVRRAADAMTVLRRLAGGTLVLERESASESKQVSGGRRSAERKTRS